MPHNSIILHTINLAGVRLQVPVADISHKIPGPTVLITGGMDGDEYTGIRAASALIEYYSRKSFPGRIIILPIVNVAGFYDGKSLNPLDGKYPKYVFPGSKNGSATEQLVDWINTNFIKGADTWIDLHSGAVSERMQPFVWGFETRNKKVNQMSKSILSVLDSPVTVYEKAPFFSKAARLASQDCIYLVFERGELGEQKEDEIKRMTQWVIKTIDVVNGKNVKQSEVSSFGKVKFYRAHFDGIWIPSINFGDVEKGSVGGSLKALDASRAEILTIKEQGTVLWMKSSLFAKKNDELVVIATQKSS